MNTWHRLSAYRELVKHYRAVFAHFWKARNSLSGGLFNEQEAEFLPAALSLQEKPVSSTARLTGRLLMALVCIALLWSILGKIDIIVNATGKIIPSERTKTLASVDVASVRALHVEEGQTVKAGDVLIELDTSASDSERDKALGDEAVATLQMARSRAMISAVDNLIPPQLPKIPGIPELQWQAAQWHLEGQYRDFRAKLVRIDGEINRYKQALPLVAQRARDYQDLAKDHDVSIHAYLEKEQARIDLEGQLAEARNQRTGLISQTRKDAYEALTEGGKVSYSSRQDALRADSHGKFLKLIAPVDGTVQQLTVHTVGGVVPSAQPLMLIVPKENLVEVEAFLENKDIGFIQEGQHAEVKIDAFEYSKYGTIPGRVTHVSRDAIQDDKKGLIYSIKVMTPLHDPWKTLPVIIKTGVTLPGDAVPVPCPTQKDFALPLALYEAVDLALCNNTQIQVAWANIKVQAAAVGEARAAYWPTLSGTVNRLNDQTRYPGSRINSSTSNSHTVYGTLSWRIFDFGGRKATLETSNEVLAAALASHDAVMQKPLTGVIQAYFDALTAKAAFQTKGQNEGDGYAIKELSVWLEAAQKQHPAILAARAQLKAARYRITSTRSDGLPTLDFSANYYENGRPGQGLTSTQTQERTLGIALTVPIFDGFSRTYKLQGTEAQLEQKAAELQDTEQQILMEVVKAHADASSSLQNLHASEALLIAAQDSLGVSRRKYEKGVADILEILSTQTALSDAQQERIRCLAEWRSARLRLLANAGLLGRAAIVP